jgi:glucosylceramidase
MRNNLFLLFFCMFVLVTACNKSGDSGSTAPIAPPPTPVNEMDLWLTTANEGIKLQKQNTVLSFSTNVNQYPNIEVDESSTFQTIDGFGFTLTGGSVEVINQLSGAKKTELLQELFGTGNTGIAISYLRLSIGASDLNSTVFSYDDMPAGQTDPTLANFSLSADATTLVPLLKEILQINPAIKIMATPWSPPVWMKDNNSTIGGSLQPGYYAVYAQYFVKYIQKMKAEGINVDAITPQNEPLHPGNNPSLLMTAAQQADFIKNHLGPAIQAAGLPTKIVIYDHNCDKPDYPIAILNDAIAKTFIDGSAFHLYAGDISAMSQVRNLHPEKNIYFTEQYTASTGGFAGDLKWHLKNVIIGSMRNWSKVALEWNLANNAAFGPHTPGGCTTCKGAITVQSSSLFTRNVGYYIIAHASKFVPAGSRRIQSNIAASLHNVAFLTPAGKRVLIVVNDGNVSEQFNIKYNGKWVASYLEAGSVATYIW